MKELNNQDLRICAIVSNEVLTNIQKMNVSSCDYEKDLLSKKVEVDKDFIYKTLEDCFFKRSMRQNITLPYLAQYYGFSLAIVTLLHEIGKKWNTEFLKDKTPKNTTKQMRIVKNNAPIAIMPPKYKVEPITINGRDQFVVYPFCYTIDNVPFRECMFCNTLADLEKIKV